MDEPKTVTVELPRGALAGWPTLIEALQTAETLTGLSLIFGGLIEQITRQTCAKLDEPDVLGTVVDARDGSVHVLAAPGTRQPWFTPDADEWNPWENIDAWRIKP